MSWVKKRVLVTVKAAPEPSKKYGDAVCTAGITEDGEWIRLYPVPLDLWRRGKGFRKFDWIEVECEKVSQEEKLGRKESHKIKGESLKIVDRSLSGNGKVDWAGRNRWLLPRKSASIEALRDAYNTDRTSLGMIRVGELIDFYKSYELSESEKSHHRVKQMVFSGLESESGSRLKPQWILDQIPHIFKYKFKCETSTCHGHDMTCEDWELFEAYRKWPDTYKTEELTFEKIKERFFYLFKEKKDIHFFMGTDSQYPSWMIIGVYYPPK
jgi:hypothetical protein